MNMIENVEMASATFSASCVRHQQDKMHISAAFNCLLSGAPKDQSWQDYQNCCEPSKLSCSSKAAR